MTTNIFYLNIFQRTLFEVLLDRMLKFEIKHQKNSQQQIYFRSVQMIKLEYVKTSKSKKSTCQLKLAYGK